MVDDAGGVEIHLARELSPFSATMMGIGATVGIGIFVLLGYAAGDAGPAVLLAIFLNGLIAALTAVTYADLGTTFPEAGGGYLWVREAMRGAASFAAGWTAWPRWWTRGAGRRWQRCWRTCSGVASAASWSKAGRTCPGSS